MFYFSCEPVCDFCGFDRNCVAPGKCACFEGFVWDEITSKCNPKCKLDCSNGFCASNNKCECSDEYEINAENK